MNSMRRLGDGAESGPRWAAPHPRSPSSMRTRASMPRRSASVRIKW